MAGHVPCVRLLLDAGAPLDAEGSEDSASAVAVAAAFGRAEVVAMLLCRGAAKATAADNRAALAELAAERGQTAVTGVLEAAEWWATARKEAVDELLGGDGGGGVGCWRHTGVDCDICGMEPILGPRYSRKDVEYNLCAACHAGLPEPSREEDYEKLVKPKQLLFDDLVALCRCARWRHADPCIRPAVGAWPCPGPAGLIPVPWTTY
eukprot:SAG11_NODE_708_length_7648_cov_3.486687_9_plen_207_part_00